MDRSASLKPGDLSDADAAAVFSTSRVAMVLTNPRLDDNPIVYVNRAFESLTGYARDSAVGRNCRFLQCDDTDPKKVERLRRAIDRGEEISLVLKNCRSDGTVFHNALMISPVRDESSGELTYFVGLQSKLEADDEAGQLKAFENAVSEIQHRVKNHLSMIIGLIRMQARKDGDLPGYADMSRRIESLQLLYEEMSAATREHNRDTIKLGAYLGRVANAIAHLDGRAGVRMNVDVEPLEVPTEVAVRIGLIVSEVLTNAMQHAFADQNSGLVDLRVMRTDDGGMRAIISDDGVGIPEDVDWPDDGGLGSRLVRGLAEGLDATLNVARGAVGTIVTLDVPNAD